MIWEIFHDFFQKFSRISSRNLSIGFSENIFNDIYSKPSLDIRIFFMDHLWILSEISSLFCFRIIFHGFFPPASHFIQQARSWEFLIFQIFFHEFLENFIDITLRLLYTVSAWCWWLWPNSFINASKKYFFKNVSGNSTRILYKILIPLNFSKIFSKKLIEELFQKIFWWV